MGKVTEEARDTEQGSLVLESSRMEVMVGERADVVTTSTVEVLTWMAVGPG